MKEMFEKLFQEGLDKAPAALQRMAEAREKPPVPIMSQEEYENLPLWRQCILICNMPGCGKVVCTHGMLCVDHTLELAEAEDAARVGYKEAYEASRSE